MYKYIHTYIYINVYVRLTASEVAKCAQEAGAVAMIYITVNDIMVTLPPSSLCLPRDWMPFAIASFNIPSNTKAAIAWRQMSSCQEASINFLHECAWVCKCVRTCVCTVCVCVCMPSRVRVCVCSCVRARVCICVYVYSYVHVCFYVSVCVYLSVNVCVYLSVSVGMGWLRLVGSLKI